MEKVLEKFKNLYKGEERLKRHGMLFLLLLLPALLGSMQYIIDKETPKEILMPALFVALGLALLCIIPMFFLNGFYVDFYKSRISSKVGLPKINCESFIKGLKVFPIQFVWAIYAFILVTIVLGIPIGLMIGCFAGGDKSSMLAGLIVFFIVFIIVYLLLMVAFLIMAPFFNYIFLSFIEDFVYRPEYFNPMTLIYYMRTVFKDTMITMLKFLLASFIINTVVQIVMMIIVIFASIFATIAGAATSGDTESLITPASMVIMIPVCTLAVLAQSYTVTIIGCAAGDAYTDIYKEQIRLPDPLEKQDDDQNRNNKDLSI